MNIWEFNVDIGLKHGCVHEMSTCGEDTFDTKDVLIMITLALTWDRNANDDKSENDEQCYRARTVNRRVNRFNCRYRNESSTNSLQDHLISAYQRLTLLIARYFDQLTAYILLFYQFRNNTTLKHNYFHKIRHRHITWCYWSDDL